MLLPPLRSNLVPGSWLLGWSRILGRFAVFLARVAVASATALGGALYRLSIQGLVVGLWLGHGQRPGRVLVVAILLLAATWLLYWQVGTFVLDADNVGRPTWRNALYYSLASFASLGYGGWVATPLGWARWVGAMESFLGIFSAVFFSVTLGQRITR